MIERNSLTPSLSPGYRGEGGEGDSRSVPRCEANPACSTVGILGARRSDRRSASGFHAMRIRRGMTVCAAVLAGLVVGAALVARHNSPGGSLLPGPSRRQAGAEATLRVVIP